jgi:hypothetical protein
MNAPDATFTNGRYELPPHARGVLVLADPPEAGWRIRSHSSIPAPTAALISKPRHERNGRHGCGRRSR